MKFHPRTLRPSQSLYTSRTTYKVIDTCQVLQRCNRVDARIVNHKTKRVVTLKMSCPWVSNGEKKNEEKTAKYDPLRWELNSSSLVTKQNNTTSPLMPLGVSREMDTNNVRDCGEQK